MIGVRSQAGQRANGGGGLEAVHAGHLQVHQDDVEAAAVGELDGGAAVARRPRPDGRALPGRA